MLMTILPDSEIVTETFLGADGLIAKAHWPGPLTLVVPLRPNASIASIVTAGLSTIALRVPAHPVVAFEHVDFMMTAQKVGRRQSRDPGSDDSDAFHGAALNARSGIATTDV